MKKTIFTGSCVAIVTPMQEDGSIHYDRLGAMLEEQIAAHTDAVCICGTTGESATMSDEEHIEAIRYTVKKVAGRIPVIAGAGSNHTDYAVFLSKEAKAAGADALLQVTPYYNKTSQQGLIDHFYAIADATDLPLILYNVPSRTGCNLLPATCAALARHPRIAAVKEASGNISQIVELAALAGDALTLYSGNDDQIVPLLAMGGSGCISVLSNVVPRQAQTLCDRFFAGDTAGAAELQCRLLPLTQALFCEVNPIPVKAALAAMGYGSGAVRLPLTPMEESRRAVLLEEMKKLGVLA